jgi:UDP-3-O-[3-hydroxymyristoyl] glucosamine N-acyltransferase
VPEGFEHPLKNLIQVANPRISFNMISEFFYPRLVQKKGIHSNACIGEGFVHGNDISMGPFTTLGDNVAIGDRVIIHSSVVIGNGVKIGDDTEIFPNVTILDNCKIGSRVIINAGTVIGSDGFGFEPDGERYLKIRHTGIVQIDDDVEIGAANTIDRGTVGKTWIKSGVKSDNLVHIAHNVVVGENTLLVAQVGIAGSTTIGRHVVLAGQAGISGHITIEDNAVIGPKTGIAQSVQKGQILSGIPGIPHKLWLRVQRTMPMLPELKKKIYALEKKINEIEQKTGF